MSRRVITIALIWLVCTLASITHPGHAFAQPELQDKYTPEEWELGTRLFEEGLSLFQDGKYAEACAKLEESYRVVAGIGVRGKIGECHEELKQYAMAWLAYRDVVEMAVKSADLQRVEVARERVAELEKRITLITIESATTSIADLVVTVDGEPVQLMERTFPLDPGKRKVKVTSKAAGESRELQKTIKARAGRRETLEVPDLSIVESDTSAEAARKGRKGSTAMVVLGMVGVGIGLGAMGTGGYFGYRARSSWEEAADMHGCNRDTGVCPSEAGLVLAEEARDHALKANILVGSGVVVGVVGTILWLSGRSTGPGKGREKNRDVAVGWRLTPGDGAGLVVSGRF